MRRPAQNNLTQAHKAHKHGMARWLVECYARSPRHVVGFNQVVCDLGNRSSLLMELVLDSSHPISERSLTCRTIASSTLPASCIGCPPAARATFLPPSAKSSAGKSYRTFTCLVFLRIKSKGAGHKMSVALGARRWYLDQALAPRTLLHLLRVPTPQQAKMTERTNTSVKEQSP